MPRTASIARIVSRHVAAVLLLWVAAAPVFAQQPPTPTRVRGTIESVDGDTINVKSRTGDMVKLHVSEQVRIVDIVKESDAAVVQALVAPGANDLSVQISDEMLVLDADPNGVIPAAFER